MADQTTITAELGGEFVEGIRELEGIELLALWDAGDVQASITTSEFRFTNSANKKLRELHTLLPTEGPTLIPSVTDGTLVESNNYFVNFDENYKIISKVETAATLSKDNGSLSFQRQARGLTMQLLKQDGILTEADWVNVPYIVVNRKRLLEFLTLQISLAQVAKQIYDEIFKLINIVSDIISGAAVITAFATVVAIINLTKSIIHLVLLTIQMVKLLIDLFNVIFPPIRYHKGIGLYNWLNKGVQRLGYELQTGLTFQFLLERIVMLGSKNDEIGKLAFWVDLTDFLDISSDEADGLLSPNDIGYTLGQMIDVMKIKYNVKVGVRDGVVHIRPQGDDFWVESTGYEMPSVLIEQALNYDNGTCRFNYEDQVIRTVVRWQRDDSDLHTLTDTNNRVAEVIWSPITIDNVKRVNLKGQDWNDIPFALCVPKPAKDNLFTKFIDLETLFNSLQNTLEDIYEEFPVLNDVELPDIGKALTNLFVKKNVLMIENHFFSVPKMLMIDPETGRIQEGFEEHIGADALYLNYHSYKAMAPGFKDPENVHDTYQQKIFENVRIPFGIKDWDQTIENSWFNSSDFGPGQFRKILWKPGEDFAMVDFHIFERWNSNLKGTLYKLGPQAAAIPVGG